MAVFTLQERTVRIPRNVVDLSSFRRWFHSSRFPETKQRIEFIQGDVWVDTAMEQIFSHNQVKSEYTRALVSLVKEDDLGRFFQNGVQIVNEAAGWSCQADGTFVSHHSRDSGRVRIVPSRQGGFIELLGSPDMVLEVVSRNSVKKDKVILREQYWLAEIEEYWLVDARKEHLEFDILRYSPKGYVPARKVDGWMKSKVFGKSFRFTYDLDRRGEPEYTLEVR